MMLTRINFRFTPLKKKVNYVVAASGGPDSMFLLEKMRILKYNFAVAHVNYKKRENSHLDEEIVRKYCKKYNLDFFSIEAKYQESRKNFQSLAREIRYNFFSDLCKEIALDKSCETSIVVAHNFEDLIETYFIQKKRNSFVNFFGLSFLSSWKDCKVYRPILSFTKTSILKYLKENNIDYAIDFTNEQDLYLRNSFRKKIMPIPIEEKSRILVLINKENKGLQKVLQSFNLIYKKVTLESEIFLNKHWISSSNEVKKRVIYRWINEFSKGSFFSRKKNILSELLKQFESDSSNVIFNFKNGFKIEKYKNSAFISNV